MIPNRKTLTLKKFLDNMNITCPKCGAELPWWWKILAGKNLFGRIFECNNCNSWIRIKANKSKAHWSIEIVLAISIILLGATKTESLFADRIGFQLGEATYPLILVLVGLLLYTVRFPDYEIEPVKHEANKRKFTYKVGIGICLVGAVILTPICIFLYIETKVTWILYLLFGYYILLYYVYRAEKANLERFKNPQG